MLLEFSCSNHKSIKEKILFSTLAGTDDTYIEKTIPFLDNKILRTSIIYGANGSGKSNFIDALSFVKNLVINSFSNQIGQGIRQIPHKLQSATTDSTYQIQFATKNTRFIYGFTLNNYLVKEEYLYYTPNGRQTKIFERKFNNFTVGSSNKFKGKLNSCKEVLKENKLLLSYAANFSNVEEIIDAYKFFSEDLVIFNHLNINNWIKYSLYQIHLDNNIKQNVIEFINSFGMKIKDIDVKIDKKKIEESFFPPFLSQEFKNLLLNKDIDAISANVIYKDFSTNLMNEESSGVYKLFALVCPILDILSKNKVLICDELESNLHESLLYKIVEIFSNAPQNNSSQLIFTNHETGLLNLNLFRRDQVWFTELKDDRSTDLYSLAELKNVRKDERLDKNYILGKYGAIPMLNKNFSKFYNSLN